MQARRSSLLTLLLVSLLGLAACGSSSTAVSTPTPTSTPTATPLVNTAYTSTDGAYSIKIPATWKTEALDAPSTSGAVSIINEASKDVFIIEPFTFRTTASTQSILGSSISDPSSFSGSKVDDTTTTKTYPSGSWIVATASTTVDDTAMSARLYRTEYGNRTFALFIMMPTANATSDQSMYFDQMLMSFTFLQ